MTQPVHLVIADNMYAVAKKNLIGAVVTAIALVCVIVYASTRPSPDTWNTTHQIATAVLGLMVVYMGYSGVTDLYQAFGIVHDPANAPYTH